MTGSLERGPDGTVCIVAKQSTHKVPVHAPNARGIALAAGIPSVIFDLLAQEEESTYPATTTLVTPLPQGMFCGTLLDHQIHALNFAQRQRRTMLALDMGLGKTVIGIAYALHYLPALIVCPAGLVPSWLDHIDTFAPTCSSTSVYLDSSHDFTIVSYNCLAKITGVYACIIADEAHYLKHAESARSKAFGQMQTGIPRTLLLTGTPAQRHQDVFHLLHLLDSSRFPTFHVRNPRTTTSSSLCFATRYCVPQPVWLGGQRHGFKYTANRNAAELRIVCERYILRLTKDILKLPTMFRQRLELESLPPAEKLAVQVELARIDELRCSYGQLRGDAALLQLCHHHALRKVPHVTPLLATRTRRCIVFFHHQDVGQAYRTWMESTRQSFVYIDGHTSTAERCRIIQTWKDNPSIVFGLFSLCATSTGLNLQFCTEILCVELTFHSAHHIQSEARIHRIGQTQEVHITYVVQPGTPDEMLWKSLTRKIETERQLFTDPHDRLIPL